MLSNIRGNVVVNITCPGLSERAIGTLNEELLGKSREHAIVKPVLPQKLREADRFAERYKALAAQLEQLRLANELARQVRHYLDTGQLDKAEAVVEFAQDFDRFAVWVEDLRIGRDHISAVVAYLNKTNEVIHVALDTPIGDRTMNFMGTIPPQMKTIGPSKTYLLDSQGDRYQFVQASGLAGGYYGWYEFLGASGPLWDEGTSALRVPPGRPTLATLMFARRQSVAQGRTFDFMSGQVLVGRDRSGRDRAVPTETFSISIRNIRPARRQ